MTHPLGLVGSRVVLGILAARRGLRTIVERPTRAARVRAVAEPAHALPSALVSFITTGRDHGAAGFDAVAGSEVLDDRIRLRE